MKAKKKSKDTVSLISNSLGKQRRLLSQNNKYKIIGIKLAPRYTVSFQIVQFYNKTCHNIENVMNMTY